MKIVISGSFRKNFEGIQTTIKEFEELGFEVLSPAQADAVDKDAEFVLLTTDDTDDPGILEERHLNAIANADALYVYNTSGYVGVACALEIGFAYANGKPIFCKEEPTDITLKHFCKKTATPKEVSKHIKTHE